MWSEKRSFPDGDRGSGEAGFGKREESWRLRCAPGNTENGAEEIMQVAQPIRLRALLRIERDRRLGGVPVLMRKRRLLREQHREDEKDSSEPA